MRLDNERPSENIEDQRGRGGFGRGFGFPRGGRPITVPIGRGGFSLSTLLILVLLYLTAKFLFGIDLLDMFRGGQQPGGQTQTDYTVPDGNTDVANPGTAPGTDEMKEFVAKVLGFDGAGVE